MNPTILIFIISAYCIYNHTAVQTSRGVLAVGGAFLLLICRPISPGEALERYWRPMFIFSWYYAALWSCKESFFDRLRHVAIAFSGNVGQAILPGIRCISTFNDATVVNPGSQRKGQVSIRYLYLFRSECCVVCAAHFQSRHLVVYGRKAIPHIMLRQYTIFHCWL